MVLLIYVKYEQFYLLLIILFAHNLMISSIAMYH